MTKTNKYLLGVLIPHYSRSWSFGALDFESRETRN